MTNLIIAGLGYGDTGLVTCGAVDAVMRADVIVVPRSSREKPGHAEYIVSKINPHARIIPLIFPMTYEPDMASVIAGQLQAMLPELKGCETCLFPTIGDCTLYSTAYTMTEAVRIYFPDVRVDFIPGISAHSIASSLTRTFLAMTDEILTVIPGTASPSRISAALKVSDAAAVYKPSAIHDIHSLVDPEDYTTIILASHAGDRERQQIITGHDALDSITEYMSVLLLKR